MEESRTEKPRPSSVDCLFMKPRPLTASSIPTKLTSISYSLRKIMSRVGRVGKIRVEA
ncbi:unnamed protein product, partial [Brassica oleracea var. botrytis]